MGADGAESDHSHEGVGSSLRTVPLMMERCVSIMGGCRILFRECDFSHTDQPWPHHNI